MPRQYVSSPSSLDAELTLECALGFIDMFLSPREKHQIVSVNDQEAKFHLGAPHVDAKIGSRPIEALTFKMRVKSIVSYARRLLRAV